MSEEKEAEKTGLERFLEVFKEELEKRVEEHPEEYALIDGLYEAAKIALRRAIEGNHPSKEESYQPATGGRWRCRKEPPPGYASCTRDHGHNGPCALPLVKP